MNERRAFTATEIIESAKSEAQSRGQDPESPKGLAGELVIGVDFGTTYTGVAYAMSSSIGRDRPAPKTQAEAEALSEKVIVIKNWPNSGIQAAEKTPSLLAYDRGKVVAWGGKVRPTHRIQIAHFKLGLQDNIAEHYWEENSTGPGGELLGGFLRDSNWKHEALPDKSALDYTAEYLCEIRKYVAETVLPTHYGAEFLSAHRISFALTVPAIWTDKAKDLTRRAAIRAGIPDDRLVLISEPEAAALYCATMCTEVDLKDGDRFLVCDAGGGTVDLISYVVKSRHPFVIAECVRGMGGACGAEYLNEAFEKLLRKKLGARANEILTPRNLLEAMRSFETTIKSHFNPLSTECEEEFEIPIPGGPELPEIGLSYGYLKVTKNEINSVFKPVFARIVRLVQDQIQEVAKSYNNTIKIVFLVGGLGSNVYLSHYLSRRIPFNIELKQPMHGWTAITRGAVLHRLGLKYVNERVLRRHYGIVSTVPFDETKHPQHLKITDLDGKTKCGSVMDWFAKRGDRIPDGYVITKPFFTVRTDATFTKPVVEHTVNLYACPDDVAPMYNNGSDLLMHCKLKVDLKRIPPALWRRGRGPYGVYHEVNFELSIIFGQTMSFKLSCNGLVRGLAEASYM